jgi:hypothetical protein
MTKRETTKAPPELDALGYAIGRDGLPTDPRHHWNADTCPREELISESISKQLDACERAWRRAGMLPALADAILMCREHNRPLPEWAALAAVAVIKKLYEQAVVTGAGRHSRLKTRDRQNAVHFIRWEMVAELRERKDELKAFGYKPTWEAAYKNVSEKLKGTFAQGTPGAVKDSYQRVARDAQRSSKYLEKYYVALYEHTGLTK